MQAALIRLSQTNPWYGVAALFLTAWFGASEVFADPAELRLAEALSHYERGPLSTRHCIATKLVTGLAPAEVELETAILEHGLHNDGPAQKSAELGVDYVQFQRDMSRLARSIKSECQLDKQPPPPEAQVKCKDGSYFWGLNPNKPIAAACAKNGGVAKIFPQKSLPAGPTRISATARLVGGNVVLQFASPDDFARWHPGRQLSFQLCDANRMCSWAEWHNADGQLVFDISNSPNAIYVRFCYVDGSGCQQSDERGFAILPLWIPIEGSQQSGRLRNPDRKKGSQSEEPPAQIVGP